MTLSHQHLPKGTTAWYQQSLFLGQRLPGSSQGPPQPGIISSSQAFLKVATHCTYALLSDMLNTELLLEVDLLRLEDKSCSRVYCSRVPGGCFATLQGSCSHCSTSMPPPQSTLPSGCD